MQSYVIPVEQAIYGVLGGNVERVRAIELIVLLTIDLRHVGGLAVQNVGGPVLAAVQEHD
jgi:hypothetical protein